MGHLRDDKGRLLPGQPPLNPGGRPQKDNEIAGLAKAHTAEAVERLVAIMREGQDRDAKTAAETLLAYGWGKPRANIKLEAEVDIGALHLKAVRAMAQAAQNGDSLRTSDAAKVIDGKPVIDVETLDTERPALVPIGKGF